MHLPVCLLQGQMARQTISVQTVQAKRGIQSHTTEHHSTLPPSLHPPPHFPICSTPSLLPHSLFIISSILCLHLCKSLNFRCTHTFSISLCMRFPPSRACPISVLSCVHLSLRFCFLSCSFSFSHPTRFLCFLSSLLSPSHYCNPSLFHQPPCKRASWLP